MHPKAHSCSHIATLDLLLIVVGSDLEGVECAMAVYEHNTQHTTHRNDQFG